MESYPLVPTIKRMRSLVALGLLAAVLLPGSVQGQGAFLYELKFRGTCYETNLAGVITATPMTETSLVARLAADASITDSSWMALVYHLNSSALGDTIDVINATNGVTLNSYLGLYFGSDETLGRVALTNAEHTAQKRIDYIYTSENSHSMGASMTSKSTVTNSTGSTVLSVQGQIQWVVYPRSGHSLRIYTGNFNTGKPLSFGN